MYTIDFDEQSRVLTFRTEGMWDLAEVERFRADLSETMRTLRSRYQGWSTLSDGRNQSVVTQDVAAALSDFLNSEEMKPAGKVAILVTKTLNKMQAERIADNPWVKAFLDEAEARAWLAAPAAA